MKSIVSWLAAAFPLLLYSQSDSTFTVNGTVQLNRGSVQKLYLSYFANNLRTTDSFAVKDNQYSFTNKFIDLGKATITATYEPCECNLATMIPSRDVITFFLEPGLINIRSTDSFSNATIQAGKANEEFSKLLALLKPFDDMEKRLEDSLGTEYDLAEKKHDSVKVKNLEAKLEAEFNVIDSIKEEDVYHAYARKNLGSPIALYVLQVYARYDFKNVRGVDPLFDRLPESVRKSNAGIHFKERIEIAKNLLPGKMAPAFTQSDTAGRAVSLSSFRGNYVLLNFWGSWCPHCRKENIYLVNTFNKYHDKPFTILSVSVDRPGEKEKWLQAIRTGHLTWTHVSDLNYLNNAVAKQYGITAIPQNFLIDPSGRIVARNLLREKLDDKLAQLFSK